MISTFLSAVRQSLHKYNHSALASTHTTVTRGYTRTMTPNQEAVSLSYSDPHALWCLESNGRNYTKGIKKDTL